MISDFLESYIDEDDDGEWLWRKPEYIKKQN
jgi:hypothetical protein